MSVERLDQHRSTRDAADPNPLPLGALLMAHDRLPTAERPAFLAAQVEDDAVHSVLTRLLADPYIRPLLEWTYLNALPFEEARRLMEAGLLFSIGEYRPLGSARGRALDDLTDLAVTPYGQQVLRERMRDPANGRAVGIDPDALLHPLVTGYVARSHDRGVVLGRDAVEAAFAACDVELLRLARDPLHGRSITTFLADPSRGLIAYRDTLLDAAPNDPMATRKAQFRPYEERGTALHDLSDLPDAETMWDEAEAGHDGMQSPWEWPETDRPRRGPLCCCEERMRGVKDAFSDTAEVDGPQDAP